MIERPPCNYELAYICHTKNPIIDIRLSGRSELSRTVLIEKLRPLLNEGDLPIR